MCAIGLDGSVILLKQYQRNANNCKNVLTSFFWWIYKY